jgi:hypothetical protein
MRNNWIFFIIIILSSCDRKSNKSTEDLSVIKFSDKYLLEWSDFRGKAHDNADTLAVTNSGIEYYFEDKSINDKLVIKFNVYSFFDKTRSWKQNKELGEDVLKHEQGHYLISELNARILRKKFKEFEFTDSYDFEIKQVFNNVFMFNEQMQDLYDEETGHSFDTISQKKWERDILTMLAMLNDFSDETFEIKADVYVTYDDIMTRKINRSFDK